MTIKHMYRQNLSRVIVSLSLLVTVLAHGADALAASSQVSLTVEGSPLITTSSEVIPDLKIVNSSATPQTGLTLSYAFKQPENVQKNIANATDPTAKERVASVSELTQKYASIYTKAIDIKANSTVSLQPTLTYPKTLSGGIYYLDLKLQTVDGTVVASTNQLLTQPLAGDGSGLQISQPVLVDATNLPTKSLSPNDVARIAVNITNPGQSVIKTIPQIKYFKNAQLIGVKPVQINDEPPISIASNQTLLQNYSVSVPKQPGEYVVQISLLDIQTGQSTGPNTSLPLIVSGQSGNVNIESVSLTKNLLGKASLATSLTVGGPQDGRSLDHYSLHYTVTTSGTPDSILYETSDPYSFANDPAEVTKVRAFNLNIFSKKSYKTTVQLLSANGTVLDTAETTVTPTFIPVTRELAAAVIGFLVILILITSLFFRKKAMSSVPIRMLSIVAISMVCCVAQSAQAVGSGGPRIIPAVGQIAGVGGSYPVGYLQNGGVAYTSGLAKVQITGEDYDQRCLNPNNGEEPCDHYVNTATVSGNFESCTTPSSYAKAVNGATVYTPWNIKSAYGDQMVTNRNNESYFISSGEVDDGGLATPATLDFYVCATSGTVHVDMQVSFYRASIVCYSTPRNGQECSGKYTYDPAFSQTQSFNYTFNPGNPPSTSVTSTFSAAPTSINVGQSTVLSWTTAGATKVNVSGSNVDGSNWSRPLNGSLSVSGLPVGTYNYVLTACTATGTIGSPQCPEKSVTVVVSPLPTPDVVMSPDYQVYFGDQFTVNWNTYNATAFTLNNQGAALNGSYSSTANALGAVTFKGVASNNFGQSGSDSTTVFVHPKPIISGDTSVYAGQSASVKLTNLGGVSGAIVQYNSGPQICGFSTGGVNTCLVSPPTTTTYYGYVCSGPGATGDCVDSNEGATFGVSTISVYPLPTITASPTLVYAGDPSTLTYTDPGASNPTLIQLWQSIGGTRTKIADNPGTMYVVRPTQTTDYFYYVCLNSGSCSDTAHTTVTIKPFPTVSGSMSAVVTPTVQSQNGLVIWDGDQFQFNWKTGNGATGVQINSYIAKNNVANGSSGAFTWNSSTSDNPSFVITPCDATRCFNQNSVTVSMKTYALPSLNSFNLSVPGNNVPGSVNVYGDGQVSLNWSTNNADSVYTDYKPTVNVDDDNLKTAITYGQSGSTFKAAADSSDDGDVYLADPKNQTNGYNVFPWQARACATHTDISYATKKCSGTKSADSHRYAWPQQITSGTYSTNKKGNNVNCDSSSIQLDSPAEFPTVNGIAAANTDDCVEIRQVVSYAQSERLCLSGVTPCTNVVTPYNKNAAMQSLQYKLGHLAAGTYDYTVYACSTSAGYEECNAEYVDSSPYAGHRISNAVTGPWVNGSRMRITVAQAILTGADLIPNDLNDSTQSTHTAAKLYAKYSMNGFKPNNDSSYTDTFPTYKVIGTGGDKTSQQFMANVVYTGNANQTLRIEYWSNCANSVQTMTGTNNSVVSGNLCTGGINPYRADNAIIAPLAYSALSPAFTFPVGYSSLKMIVYRGNKQSITTVLPINVIGLTHTEKPLSSGQVDYVDWHIQNAYDSSNPTYPFGVTISAPNSKPSPADSNLKGTSSPYAFDTTTTNTTCENGKMVLTSETANPLGIGYGCARFTPNAYDPKNPNVTHSFTASNQHGSVTDGDQKVDLNPIDTPPTTPTSRWCPK